MSLVVLAPLRLEAVALRRGLRDPSTYVVRTGMGPARSRAAARRVADCHERSSVVAVAGVCGGVDPGLRPGDVVVAAAVRRADGVARELPAAAELAAAVRRLGLRCVTGTILSVERLARDARRASQGHDDVVAVDMESAWLVESADEGPVAVLRVVADAEGRSVYDPRTLVDGAKALRVLRRSAPALEEWARAERPRGVGSDTERPPARSVGGGSAHDSARLAGTRTIGLSAGASAPERRIPVKPAEEVS